jgi:hypothetical protein
MASSNPAFLTLKPQNSLSNKIEIKLLKIRTDHSLLLQAGAKNNKYSGVAG